MVFTVTFIVFSILGITNASYLVYKHYRKQPLVCPLDHDCSVVTESKWSHIFGVRNEILGLLFYVLMFLTIIYSLGAGQFAGTIHTLLMFATFGGLIFSIFLTSVSLFIIKDYCFYCLISASLSLLLFLNSLVL